MRRVQQGCEIGNEAWRLQTHTRFVWPPMTCCRQLCLLRSTTIELLLEDKASGQIHCREGNQNTLTRLFLYRCGDMSFLATCCNLNHKLCRTQHDQTVEAKMNLNSGKKKEFKPRNMNLHLVLLCFCNNVISLALRCRYFNH